MPVEKKVWTRDEINQILQTNTAAVEKAMVRLFELQTADEQSSEETQHLNQRGFGAAYANKGSYYAKWVLGLIPNHEGKFVKRHLTGQHLDNARRIALLHSKQLVEIANRGG